VYAGGDVDGEDDSGKEGVPRKGSAVGEYGGGAGMLDSSDSAPQHCSSFASAAFSGLVWGFRGPGLLSPWGGQRPEV
jgi:hypothetical protein